MLHGPRRIPKRGAVNRSAARWIGTPSAPSVECSSPHPSDDRGRLLASVAGERAGVNPFAHPFAKIAVRRLKEES